MTFGFSTAPSNFDPQTGGAESIRHALWCDIHPEVKGELFIETRGDIGGAEQRPWCSLEACSSSVRQTPVPSREGREEEDSGPGQHQHHHWRAAGTAWSPLMSETMETDRFIRMVRGNEKMKFARRHCSPG